MIKREVYSVHGVKFHTLSNCGHVALDISRLVVRYFLFLGEEMFSFFSFCRNIKLHK